MKPMLRVLLIFAALSAASPLRAEPEPATKSPAEVTADLLRNLGYQRSACTTAFGKSDQLRALALAQQARLQQERKKYEATPAKKLDENGRIELEEKMAKILSNGLEYVRNETDNTPRITMELRYKQVPRQIPRHAADAMARNLLDHWSSPTWFGVKGRETRPLLFSSISKNHLDLFVLRHERSDSLPLRKGQENLGDLLDLMDRTGERTRFAKSLTEDRFDGFQVSDISELDALLAPYFPKRYVEAVDRELGRLGALLPLLEECGRHEAAVRSQLPDEVRLSTEIEYRPNPSASQTERQRLEGYQQRYERFLEKHRALPGHD